jgi:hypothetical protein
MVKKGPGTMRASIPKAMGSMTEDIAAFATEVTPCCGYARNQGVWKRRTLLPWD